MLPYICQTAAYITFGTAACRETSGENSSSNSGNQNQLFVAVTVDQHNSLTVYDLWFSREMHELHATYIDAEVLFSLFFLFWKTRRRYGRMSLLVL